MIVLLQSFKKKISDNFIKNKNLTEIPICDTEQMNGRQLWLIKGGRPGPVLLRCSLSPGPSSSSTSGCILGNPGLLGKGLGTQQSG